MNEPRTALFLVQGEDLREETMRRFLATFDILICNASVPAEEIRAAAPYAQIVAYFLSHAIEGGGPNNPFWQDLREVMDPYTLKWNGDHVVDKYGNRELKLTFAAAESYADWIKYLGLGHDFLYLDEAWGAPPHQYWDRTTSGVPDYLRWDLWLRYLSLNVGRPVVGNVGSNPPQNHSWAGISVESNHYDQMPDWYNRHFAKNPSSLNIVWGKPREADPLGIPGLFAAGWRMS